MRKLRTEVTPEHRSVRKVHPKSPPGLAEARGR